MAAILAYPGYRPQIGPPGSSLLVNHHDRKASPYDFIDSVSGTHRQARRRRHHDRLWSVPAMSAHGLIKITGRDHPDGE
jgi:hypothetical protein